jgi:raffinose/stachyose/melibiose transport system substrate-binding protein
MRTPRRTLGLAAALAVTASLTACGSSSGDNVLHVVGWKGGGAEPANVAEINAAFEKAHPDIELDFQYVPPNDVYLQKVQSQLLAGNAADVVMVDPHKVQSWGRSGYFADLSGERWTGRIAPQVKGFVSYRDKVLAAPMELTPIGVYVNLDILTSAGITTPPTDWPGFLDTLTKLETAGKPGLAFPNAQGTTAEFAMLMSAATTVYRGDPDWDQRFMKGEVTFPRSYRTPLEQIRQLGADGHVDFRTATGTDEATTGQPDFIAGKSAFFVGGSWQAAAMKKAGFTLGFVPWPGGEAGTEPSALLFPGTMWALNASSEQQDAARTYLDFWATSGNLAPFLTAEAAIGPYGDTPGADPLLATMTAAHAEDRYALFPANTWNLADPEVKIRKVLQGFMLGTTDLETALDEIQKAAKPS